MRGVQAADWENNLTALRSISAHFSRRACEGTVIFSAHTRENERAWAIKARTRTEHVHTHAHTSPEQESVELTC